jgi:hypothetical protein
MSLVEVHDGEANAPDFGGVTTAPWWLSGAKIGKMEAALAPCPRRSVGEVQDSSMRCGGEEGHEDGGFLEENWWRQKFVEEGKMRGGGVGEGSMSSRGGLVGLHL